MSLSLKNRGQNFLTAGSQHFFAKLLTEADSVISLAVYCITQKIAAVSGSNDCFNANVFTFNVGMYADRNLTAAFQ